MDKVYGNPTTTPININNFVGKASSINNKASGESIFLADSSENKLNNLIIYGKTTQAAEPTLDAPQELVSVGAEPFNVVVAGNNLFNPTAISVSLKDVTTTSNYGNIESTEYNGEIKLIAPKFKYNPNSSGADNYPTSYINGTFYIWMDEEQMKISESGETYTFIADIVLDKRFNNEVSGEPAPDTMSITGTGGGLTTSTATWTGINSEGKSVGRFVGMFVNKYKKASGVIDYTQQNRIEIRTCGKSITFTKIMLLPGDWTSNPPEYEDYKGQVLTIEAKTTLGNADNRAGIVGIPVKSGGNYTDENGQNWIANTIDFKNGKLYKRVWGRQLPALGWTMSYMTDDGDYIFYRETDWTFGEHLEVLCNYFPNKIMPTEGHGIWISKNENGNAVIYIKASFVSPSELEEFITTNRPYIYYAHSSATATTLKAEELEQYKSLASYYPTTRVINSEDAHMEVEYVADTKNYIDNKFAELTALVLEG